MRFSSSALRFPVLWLALVLPAGLLAQPTSFTKTFGAAHIPLGGSTSLTFSLGNVSDFEVEEISFTDTLPAGLVVATPNGLTGSCGGGTITATAASSSVSLLGATLDENSSCTFSVNVTGTTAGTKNNTTGQISCDCDFAGPSASASVTVNLPSPPTIHTLFGAANIAVGSATSLSFTIANPNASASLSGVGFTDSLPAGLVVATPNGLTGSCGGGTIAATAASGSVSLSGATLAANSSCTFSVNVTGTTTGTKNNTTSTVSSNEAGAGGTASASLAVQTVSVPLLSPLAFAGLALLLAGLGWVLASRQGQRSRPNV
jgi:hypothetical protein